MRDDESSGAPGTCLVVRWFSVWVPPSPRGPALLRRTPVHASAAYNFEARRFSALNSSSNCQRTTPHARIAAGRSLWRQTLFGRIASTAAGYVSPLSQCGTPTEEASHRRLTAPACGTRTQARRQLPARQVQGWERPLRLRTEPAGVWHREKKRGERGRGPLRPRAPRGRQRVRPRGRRPKPAGSKCHHAPRAAHKPPVAALFIPRLGRRFPPPLSAATAPCGLGVRGRSRGNGSHEGCLSPTATDSRREPRVHSHGETSCLRAKRSERNRSTK